MNKVWKILGVSLFTLLLFTANNVFAGSSGKIHGTVVDGSGEPLPGANVVIKGTARGATTDVDGYYAIINLNPGAVAINASLVGYETVVIQNVVVIVDQTVTIDFKLKESAVALGEMVVVAERPLVEPDKTTSKYTITADETERMLSAVRNTAELLALQPGVSVDGSNQIRGGFVDAASYGSDVAYMVDGIRMNHNDGRGDGGKFRTVNRGAIQELSILTGVTPAEYGNAQGGIVQIITKDGGNQYNGWGEYRFEPAGKKHWGENVYDAALHRDNIKWDDTDWLNERWPDLDTSDPTLEAQAGELIHKRSDYTGQSGWDAEGNISGPILDKMSFVLTAKHSRLANPLPGATSTGFLDDTGNFLQTGANNMILSGSLTYKPTESMKLKFGGLHQSYEYYSNGVPDAFGKSRSSSLDGVIRGLGGGGRDLFLPDNWSAAGKQKQREEVTTQVCKDSVFD